MQYHKSERTQHLKPLETANHCLARLFVTKKSHELLFGVDDLDHCLWSVDCCGRQQAIVVGRGLAWKVLVCCIQSFATSGAALVATDKVDQG